MERVLKSVISVTSLCLKTSSVFWYNWPRMQIFESWSRWMMLWRMTPWDSAPMEDWSSVWSISPTTLTGWRRVLVMWRMTTYCLIALVRGDVPDVWGCWGLAWNGKECCVLLTAGQIELYTHLPVMKQLVEQLQQWEFRVCGVFLVDSQFMVETFKVTLVK